MQVFVRSVRRTTRVGRCLMLLSVLPLVMLLNGCAIQKSYRFAAKAVTKISYDPSHCTELLDGRYRCNNVVFTVSSIDAPKAK